LEAVPELEQLRAVAVQLARLLRGGDTLSDAAHDQDQGAGSPPEAVEDRAGEGVEDPTAVAAAEVEDGGAMTAMGHHPVSLMAARAGQAVGMQPFDELGVAGVLVHQFSDREVHGQLRTRVMRSDTSEYQPARWRL
jgi:hypothetical protein